MIIIKNWPWVLIFLLVLFALRYGYKYSPYKLEFLGHYDKVWAHRVNSLEKLDASLKYFKGVELDLVYEENTGVLDVNHPPTISIDLTFETYIHSIPEKTFPYLWLDIKNLTKANASVILERITNLLSNKSYPFEKVLIETKEPEALSIFQEKGFLTSYYLPYLLFKKDKSSLDAEIKLAKDYLLKNPVMGISFDYRDYDIVNKHFSERKKYIWKIDGFSFNNYFETRKILKDSSVKVMLSRFISFKGNR